MPTDTPVQIQSERDRWDLRELYAAEGAFHSALSEFRARLERIFSARISALATGTVSSVDSVIEPVFSHRSGDFTATPVLGVPGTR